jgi:hypothetical protein
MSSERWPIMERGLVVVNTGRKSRGEWALTKLLHNDPAGHCAAYTIRKIIYDTTYDFSIVSINNFN